MDASPTRRGLFRWLALSAALPAAIAITAGADSLHAPRKPDRPKTPHLKCGCEVVE